jgi:multidrug efflux pump subunit AcrB
LADTLIPIGRRSVRLGDIATIKRGYEDPPSSIVRHNGTEAVGVVFAMTK